MWNLLLLKVFIVVFFLSSAFLLLIPRSVRSYERWREGGSLPELSNAFLIFSMACGMLLLVYLIYVLDLVRTDSYGLPSWGLLIINVFLLYLTYSLFIPQTVLHFRKWKEEHKPFDGSVVCFFAFLVLCVFSFLCIKALVALFNTRF